MTEAEAGAHAIQGLSLGEETQGQTGAVIEDADEDMVCPGCCALWYARGAVFASAQHPGHTMLWGHDMPGMMCSMGAWGWGNCSVRGWKWVVSLGEGGDGGLLCRRVGMGDCFMRAGQLCCVEGLAVFHKTLLRCPPGALPPLPLRRLLRVCLRPPSPLSTSLKVCLRPPSPLALSP